MNSQGPAFYAISVGGAAAHLAWQLTTVDYNDPRDCWRKFASNSRLGAVVWGGVLADWAWKTTAAATAVGVA